MIREGHGSRLARLAGRLLIPREERRGKRSVGAARGHDEEARTHILRFPDGPRVTLTKLEDERKGTRSAQRLVRRKA